MRHPLWVPSITNAKIAETKIAAGDDTEAILIVVAILLKMMAIVFLGFHRHPNLPVVFVLDGSNQDTI